MTEKFNLKELSCATSPVSSTASISLSIQGKLANTISIPTFLYYSMKAKALATLGVADEQEAIDLGFDVKKHLMLDIRELGKTVHRDLNVYTGEEKIYVSSSTQNRILSKVLNEKDGGIKSLVSDKSEPVNAYKTKKNVTIPNHIYTRLITLFGTKRTAKSYVHEAVSQIKDELEDGGFLVNNKLVGEAANSTWSKKLYNKIIFEFISLSDIPELDADTSILDIKMYRDYKVETKLIKVK